MPPDDQHFTFNELANEDKELLLRHGYNPSELMPEEMRDLLLDLKDANSDDYDSDRLSGDVPADER